MAFDLYLTDERYSEGFINCVRGSVEKKSLLACAFSALCHVAEGLGIGNLVGNEGAIALNEVQDLLSSPGAGTLQMFNTLTCNTFVFAAALIASRPQPNLFFDFLTDLRQKVPLLRLAQANWVGSRKFLFKLPLHPVVVSDPGRIIPPQTVVLVDDSEFDPDDVL